MSALGGLSERDAREREQLRSGNSGHVLTPAPAGLTSHDTGSGVPTTYDRFWRHVDRSAGPTGCWPWTGHTNPDGVGVFKIRGRRTTARRYAYRMDQGDPGRLRVVTRCPLTSCCNPKHLTAREPATIALSNGSAAGVNAAGAQCRRGHPRTVESVYEHPGDGRRECRACKAERRVDIRVASG